MLFIVGEKPFEKGCFPEPLFRNFLHSGVHVGTADADSAGKKGLAEGLGTHLSLKGGSQQ